MRQRQQPYSVLFLPVSLAVREPQKSHRQKTLSQPVANWLEQKVYLFLMLLQYAIVLGKSSVNAFLHRYQALVYGITIKQIFFQNPSCPLTELCAAFRLDTIANRYYYIKVIKRCPVIFPICGSSQGILDN